MSGFNFDLNEVQETVGGVIPAGTYRASVESSVLKETKSGGLMIECQFTITDEKHNVRS